MFGAKLIRNVTHLKQSWFLNSKINVLLGGFLTAVFFLVVFAVGAVEVVILFGSPIISITDGEVALVLLSVLIVTLNLACLMYGNSVSVRDL